MKKIVLIASMFLLGQASFAQDMNKATEIAANRTVLMTEQLALDAQQQENVKNLLTGIEMKLEAARNEPSFTPEQRAEQIQMNKDAEIQMLGNILTVEQMEKYKIVTKRSATKMKESNLKVKN
jgi:hypothetical protein